MFYRLVRLASIPVFLAFFGLRRSRVQVPAGPLIVAANHVSFLDPAVLGSVFPRSIHFLMNEKVWRLPLLNWFYRGMQAVPVDRSAKGSRRALASALVQLGAGRVVGIFPEGGRVPEGESREGLSGVALLARRTGCPVMPCGLRGTAEALPIGGKLPQLTKVEVCFGEPLEHASFSERTGLTGREADQAFTTELMRRIAELAGTPEEAREAA
ncbi:MAG: lysophospholipid acyltransferase family protein [Acidobacteriota bacterium]